MRISVRERARGACVPRTRSPAFRSWFSRDSAADGDRLGKAVRFAAKPYGKTRGGWRCEWAVPWNALGLKPAPGQKIAFNLGVRHTEAGVWRCYEGTLRQNWRLDEAGTTQLK